MSSVPLFKNRHGNVCVVKGNNMFNFNSGRFFTTAPDKIRILLALAEKREQGVFIDPKEPEVDPTSATPMEVLKKKHIAEYLAEQGKLKDMGNSDAPGLQKSAGHTASSVIMGNSLAEIVQEEKIKEDLKVEEPVAASMAPEKGAALGALEKLKAQTKQ